VTKIESTARSATDGHGVVWVLSHQIEEEVRDGRLQTVVQDAEPDPTPVYLLAPEGRLSLPKVGSFVDFAAARLNLRMKAFPTAC
jgi:DNA-binding transcriptional LysR family regulator